MKKIDIIGQIFTANNGQKYKVIREVPEQQKNTEYYYEIQFLKTQSRKIVEKRDLRKGCVKDSFDPHIYGVAYKGNANATKPLFNKIAFKRWYAMIERCYNVNAINYHSYGAVGVRVCERWLCFENYLNDIQLLDGFDEQAYIKKEIELDKDSTEIGNKIYSPQKCRFVTRKTNIRSKPSTSKPFVAISPSGEKYIFDNQSECAENFGLIPRTIGKVLHGQLNHHHGWKFHYLESNDYPVRE